MVAGRGWRRGGGEKYSKGEGEEDRARVGEGWIE